MKCMDCVYCGVEGFVRVSRGEDAMGNAADVEVAAEECVCRFYPPSGATRVKPIWPVVDRGSDWCGMGKAADGKTFVG